VSAVVLPEKVNLRVAVNGAAMFEYLTIGRMNGHTLRVLQVENRTLDFHTHETSDELFYVMEGAFSIEFEEGAVSLNAGDMLIIPKGIRHRPVVTECVKCLLIELDGTLDAGNTGGGIVT
jgi:mannose-6-phosphate isomerase-like protein (cupin superfamily)